MPEHARIIMGDDDDLLGVMSTRNLIHFGHQVVCEVYRQPDEGAVLEVTAAVLQGAQVAVFDGSFINKGGEFGRRLIEACKEIPVIAFTAGEEDQKWARATVRRPLGHQELARIINDL